MTQEERIMDLVDRLNEALFVNAELESSFENFENKIAEKNAGIFKLQQQIIRHQGEITQLELQVSDLKWDVDYWRSRYDTATDNLSW